MSITVALSCAGFVACDDIAPPDDKSKRTLIGDDPVKDDGTTTVEPKAGDVDGDDQKPSIDPKADPNEEPKYDKDGKIILGDDNTVADDDPAPPEEVNGWKRIVAPEGIEPGSNGASALTISTVAKYNDDFIFFPSGTQVCCGGPDANGIIRDPVRAMDGIIRSYDRAAKVWREARPPNLALKWSAASFHAVGKDLYLLHYGSNSGAGTWAKGGKVLDMSTGVFRDMNMTGLPDFGTNLEKSYTTGSSEFIIHMTDKLAVGGAIYNVANDSWVNFPTANNLFTTNGCTLGTKYYAARIVGHKAVVAIGCGKKVGGASIIETRADFLDLDTMTWKKTDSTALVSMKKFYAVETSFGLVLQDNVTKSFKLDAQNQTIVALTSPVAAAFTFREVNGHAVTAWFDATNKKIVHSVDGVLTPLTLDPDIFGKYLYELSVPYASDKYVIAWRAGREILGFPILTHRGTGYLAGSPDKYMWDKVAAVYDVARAKWFELPLVNRPRADMPAVFDVNETKNELTVWGGGYKEAGSVGFFDGDGGVIKIDNLQTQARQCVHVKRDMIYHGSDVLRVARGTCKVKADCQAWHVMGLPIMDYHFPVNKTSLTAGQKAEMAALAAEASNLCGEEVFEDDSVPYSTTLGCNEVKQCTISFGY